MNKNMYPETYLRINFMKINTYVTLALGSERCRDPEKQIFLTPHILRDYNTNELLRFINCFKINTPALMNMLFQIFISCEPSNMMKFFKNTVIDGDKRIVV